MRIAKEGSTFDVREYGCDGTPEGDTRAVKAALQDLHRQGGSLYFPHGEYLLSERLLITETPGCPVAIRGDGAGLSRLIWDCSDGGIAVSFLPEGGYDGHKGAILVSGLTLLTTQPDTGTALTLDSRGDTTSPAPTKRIRDLVMAGVAPTAGWACGIRARDCTFTTITSVAFQGVGQHADLSLPRRGVAIRFEGVHEPTDNAIEDLRVFGAHTGVEFAGNGEGLHVSRSTILFVERGIHWTTTAGEPLLSVTASHISAARDCILASNLLQPFITGNLLYQFGQRDWTGIWLKGDEGSNTNLLQISGNTIHGFSKGTSPKNGIVLSGMSGGIVCGNQIHNVDTGIWLQEGTSGLAVLDNRVQDSSVADILDEGAGNTIRKI